MKARLAAAIAAALILCGCGKEKIPDDGYGHGPDIMPCCLDIGGYCVDLRDSEGSLSRQFGRAMDIYSESGGEISCTVYTPAKESKDFKLYNSVMPDSSPEFVRERFDSGKNEPRCIMSEDEKQYAEFFTVSRTDPELNSGCKEIDYSAAGKGSFENDISAAEELCMASLADGECEGFVEIICAVGDDGNDICVKLYRKTERTV